ncbi:hypothetical protein [Moraxella boevrei]|uniref:hypothetical protein n=1 Tax=Faucicola boevrei TaxID=346665 RepID=UPI0037369571
MIGLRLFSDNGQALGEIVGDYFKLSGVFRLDDNTPLRSDGRAFIDYPAVVNKNGKRYQRERLFCVSYDSSDEIIINPITITKTDNGALVYRTFNLRKAKHTPATIYYGYIDEIPL